MTFAKGSQARPVIAVVVPARIDADGRIQIRPSLCRLPVEDQSVTEVIKRPRIAWIERYRLLQGSDRFVGFALADQQLGDELIVGWRRVLGRRIKGFVQFRIDLVP